MQCPLMANTSTVIRGLLQLMLAVTTQLDKVLRALGEKVNALHYWGGLNPSHFTQNQTHS